MNSNPISYHATQNNRTLSEFFTPADNPQVIDEVVLLKKLSKTDLSEYKLLSSEIDTLRADLARMAKFSETAKESTRRKLEETKQKLADIRSRYLPK